MIEVETLIGIFTIIDSDIKILLTRKEEDPYKGYWILPGKDLALDETIENNVTDVVIEKTMLSNILLNQCHTFSSVDRIPGERKLAITFTGLVDSKTAELKSKENIDNAWFSIFNIPKTAYDHDSIIEYMVDTIKKSLTNTSTLKTLFPSDFTLPELQKIYEQIFNKQIDRRNFRKKFMLLGLIEETGYNSEGFSGRPAKLYRFKTDIKEKELFS